MNPSTQDIVDVIEKSQCKRAIILPNNKNILMASEQAAEIVDAEVVVIPTRSIPQGISSLFNFDVSDSLADNKARMVEAIEMVTSGAITYAVRDTTIDDVEIKKDAFMGLKEDKIIASHPEQLDTIKALLTDMLDDDSEIVTMITGEDATDSVTDAVVEWLEENYEDVEIDQHEGQQPVYHYLFAVE